MFSYSYNSSVLSNICDMCCVQIAAEREHQCIKLTGSATYIVSIKFKLVLGFILLGCFTFFGCSSCTDYNNFRMNMWCESSGRPFNYGYWIHWLIWSFMVGTSPDIRYLIFRSQILSLFNNNHLTGNLWIKNCTMFDWFVHDVAGIICSTMTYLLILYSQFVIVTVVLLPQPLVGTVVQVCNVNIEVLYWF